MIDDKLKRRILTTNVENPFFSHQSSDLSDISPEYIYNYFYNYLPSRFDLDNLTPDCLKIFEDSKFSCLCSMEENVEGLPSDLFFDGHFPDDVSQFDETNWRVSIYIFRYIPNEKELPIIAIVKVNHRERVVGVRFSFADVNNVKPLIHQLSKFAQPQEDTKIGLLNVEGDSVRIKKLKLTTQDINLALTYSDDFIKVHDTIVSKLKNKSAGLFLFHGDVGTGKTTYIKHLAKVVKDRLFVFIPTNMIDSIVTPSLIGVLINSPNCVLVLEDAEKAIVAREDSSDPSLVSNILNLSDGILGTLLNTAIIVTFNTQRQNIDKALLRKGRLMVEHKFSKLPIKDAQRLIDSLKKNFVVKEPMSIADIYNLEEENFHIEDTKGVMGFGK